MKKRSLLDVLNGNLDEVEELERRQRQILTETSSMLRSAREAAGLTQNALATLAGGGVDQAYVSNVEHGRKIPSEGTIRHFLAVLEDHQKEAQSGSKAKGKKQDLGNQAAQDAGGARNNRSARVSGSGHERQHVKRPKRGS